MKRLYLFSSDLELEAALAGNHRPADVDVAGVGLVDAAIGTTRALYRHAPDEIVFIGTAGAFQGRGVSVGELVIARRAVVLSGDVARGAMRLPSLLASSVNGDEEFARSILSRLSKSGTSTSLRTIGSTLGVTEGADLSSTLNSWEGADVENLEAFGVMRACQDRVRCVVVLSITNVVGPGGGQGWRSNFVNGMRVAYGSVRRALAE